MDASNYRTELLLIAAERLAESHGVFFAAALLADFGVPLGTALRALSTPAERHRRQNFRAAVTYFDSEDNP